MTPRRWDAWFKLSAKTRKETDPRAYAKGVTVAVQRRERAESVAIARLSRLSYKSRVATIRQNVKQMTTTELRRILNMSDSDVKRRARSDALKNQRLRRQGLPLIDSPFFYH